MEFPSIPNEYLLVVLLVGMLILAAFNIDSWTHATIGAIMGYLIGNKVTK